MPRPVNSSDEDFDRAVEAALQAGALALSRFKTGIKGWRKVDGTPISDVDLEVDDLLRRRLLRVNPHYGWHSEESQASTPVEGRFWLVDPLDGTSAYLSGSDSWCIALALIEEGRPVMGVIHAPAQRALYSAVKGRGALLNGAPIRVSGRTDLDGAKLIMNSTALKPTSWRQALPRIERLAVPSIALRLAHVAQGLSDGALALNYKHDWDLAAGDLLVSEALGRVSDLDGRELSYDPHQHVRLGFIAATPAVHAALLARGPKALGRT